MVRYYAKYNKKLYKFSQFPKFAEIVARAGSARFACRYFCEEAAVTKAMLATGRRCAAYDLRFNEEGREPNHDVLTDAGFKDYIKAHRNRCGLRTLDT